MNTERYELIIVDILNARMVDKENNTIVAFCGTKRPDLGFKKLIELVELANVGNGVVNNDR